MVPANLTIPSVVWAFAKMGLALGAEFGRSANVIMAGYIVGRKTYEFLFCRNKR